nr:hypothetical protein [Metamycoplasma hominis]
MVFLIGPNSSILLCKSFFRGFNSLSILDFLAFAVFNACCNASFAAIMSDLFEDSTTEFLASFAAVNFEIKAE